VCSCRTVESFLLPVGTLIPHEGDDRWPIELDWYSFRVEPDHIEIIGHRVKAAEPDGKRLHCLGCPFVTEPICLRTGDARPCKHGKGCRGD